MIHPSEVSAVLVTRGDIDLSPVLESVAQAGITDVVVWNNAERPKDVACYGRYLGIAEAKHDIIFHQDDDLISPIAELCGQYDPRRDRYSIVSNNRIDEEWPLTGIGSLFHRELADCFTRYIDVYGEDEDFYRICDVVFAYQHPYRRVVLGYSDLPWHSNPAMYTQDGHIATRIRARQRILSLPFIDV